MSRQGDPGEDRVTDAADLHATVLEVRRDLELLSSRVAELAEATQAMAAERDGASPRSARASRSQRASRGRSQTVTVTVRPLPELAMAAVAETSLRGLPGVQEVVSVERFDDWARFRLEVAEGTDLVAETRAVLPVSFRSEQSESGEIRLDLNWAWGAGGDRSEPRDPSSPARPVPD